MRKLIYSMLTSLDLYVEGPDGQFGWATPDAELHKHFNANAATMTTHLYGRRMWETLSAYWPTAESDPAGTPETREFARFWNAGEHIKPFFPGLKGRLDLTLLGVQTFASGVVQLRYAPRTAGA
jgi:hypothetical protein